MDQPPTRADLEAIGRERVAAVAHSREVAERATEMVLAWLRNGGKPTEAAAATQWTPAHIRKLARDNGIPAAEQYAERSKKMRRTNP